MKEAWWHGEARVHDSDLAVLVVELVRTEARFACKPEPDGWWRVRSDLFTYTSAGAAVRLTDLIQVARGKA